jgi:outer membrane protein OmpA-like peptidoglycan-associated protein
MATKTTALALAALGCLAVAAGGCSESTSTPTASNQGSALGNEFTPVDPGREGMHGVLVAQNQAVYSNTLLMKRPNLYRVGQYSAAQGHGMSGTRAPGARTSGSTMAAGASREAAVEFEFNKSTLTPQARQTVDAVANAAKNNRGLQIGLVGKADRVGSDQYNMALSQRRTDAVHSQLVADGVDPSQIVESRWVGERQPPVPTPDGVKEARNRVVDITVTELSGASAPPPPEPPPVLFTNTEESPPGANGQWSLSALPNGSMIGPFAP